MATKRKNFKYLMGVYQVCSNKSPWVKIGPARGGEAYIQVSDFRAIMALLFTKVLHNNVSLVILGVFNI
jgi:hypothetical protein